jgi:hypothetical protein
MMDLNCLQNNKKTTKLKYDKFAVRLNIFFFLLYRIEMRISIIIGIISLYLFFLWFSQFRSVLIN